ncbi:MAG: hypothetical protein JW753_00375 [Dehalococcoidia bacterium]|nr:hypothetical protein [Dehalococcoidia bacterium]
MKRRAVLHIALCVLVIAAAGVLGIVGCGSSNPVGTSVCVPVDFVYAGNRYICTSVVANQDIDAGTPSNVMYIGSTSYQIGEYDVYLIQGVDEEEAIALKIGRAGGYTYRRYERVYGQEEPSNFVYQGRDYAVTAEIIDIQRKRDDDAGEPESVSYLSSIIYQGTTYDVYSIQGTDEDQAIALRIAKAGKSVGFYHYYFKYERR